MAYVGVGCFWLIYFNRATVRRFCEEYVFGLCALKSCQEDATTLRRRSSVDNIMPDKALSTAMKFRVGTILLPSIQYVTFKP